MSNANHPAEVLLHWDEYPWLEHRAGIRACSIPVDRGLYPRGAVLVAVDYPAGAYAAPHYHTVGHLEIVLEGTLYVGGRPSPPLSVRVVDAGYVYGPLEARDGRCKVLEIFPESTTETVIGRYDPEVLARGGRTEADVLRGVERMLGIAPSAAQA